MKEWNNWWNSFNSNKSLVHVSYWKDIIDSGVIPPPIFVSVDLSYPCNFNCMMCNSAYSRSQSNLMMSLDYIKKLPKFLSNWGTKAICTGGLGDSLMNKNFDIFAEECKNNNIKHMLITNGSLLDKHHNINLLDFLGISVNAGNAQIFEDMGMHNKEMFYKVINNIKTINNNKTNLETTFKFLITPINCDSIYEAVKLAKEIGCNNFHSRPAGNPWFNLHNKLINFTNEQVEKTIELSIKAREDFEDDNFKVYTITHKFNTDFSVKHNFDNCYSTFVTCHTSPGGYWGLCCDRRGDKSLELCIVNEPEEVLLYWGTDKHKELVKNIDIKKCPRCTLGFVQNIFEHVIIKDDMNVEFI